MIKPPAILALLCCAACLSLSALAQVQEAIEFRSLTDDGRVDWNPQTGAWAITNGALVSYGGAVLTADRARGNLDSGEVTADGRVRIQRDNMLWAGDHIRYNFKTRQMETEQFRTGRSPLFVGAHGLHGDVTNGVYTATNAFVTTDDFAVPFERVWASRIKILPGDYVEMRNATLLLGGVPVFYFPYFKGKLDGPWDQFRIVPGYRSRLGAFVLGSYTWFLNDTFDGALHLDYRSKRGGAAGPDLNAHMGRWGEAALSYYYAYDNAPEIDLPAGIPPHNRQHVQFSYLATPFTNVTLRSQVRYQSDAWLEHDFFESVYRRNPQPITFVEATKFWSNFALDLYAQPRVNGFLDSIERLPEVKLTGWRQQLGPSPLYYESETAAGFYRRRYAETNGVAAPDYEAFRGDTYHQVVVPWTLFGWLNVAPRVGGRLTYYGEATATNVTSNEIYRGIFNTGAEVSFKASRLWAGVTNRLLQVDGLRHIVEPSLNYVFVPTPNERPWELPQFDSELPSLRLLPIEFPDYNAVDSVDSQNVLRLGLRNRLQTRRDGQLEDLVDWTIFADWRLQPRDDQSKFSDVYSDLTFRPRSWLTLASEVRYGVDDGAWRLALHTLTLQPNDTWHWSFSHYYLRDEPAMWGAGNNLISSSLFYRLNENWAMRASHYFSVRDGRLQEQFYTLYRDFRSWTGALTFRAQDNLNQQTDYTVAFTLSLKAAPKFRVGEDAVRPYGLIGY